MAFHPVDVHVGRRLRLLRDQAGITQKDLAKSIDCSFQQLQKYETGSNRISMSRLWALCLRLRVQPSDFFEGLKGDKISDPPPVYDRAQVDLNVAFSEIGDLDTRRKLLALTRCIARLDSDPQFTDSGEPPHPIDHADSGAG